MRPDYTADELDDTFQVHVSEFLRRKYGEVAFPIPISDLRDLLEKETKTLDLRTDSHNEGGQFEVLVEFQRGNMPVVRIASKPSLEATLENRLRVAFAHAYGHILLHDFLFQSEEGLWLSLFDHPPEPRLTIHRCRHESLTPLVDDDWMEWQAGFACGALLIPIDPLIALVREFRHSRDLDLAVLSDRSLDGATLIREVAERFQTSWNTAWIRLIQRKILSTADIRSLF